MCLAAAAAIALFLCYPAHAEPRVLLLRGWFGVFSTGLDSIADALREKGIRAEVIGHLQWKAAADDILQHREPKSGALVLVGHSQGANNVIDMARLLEPHHVPVALLVALAPYMQNPIPSNVVRAIDYYQSSGWGAPIAAGPGFRGELLNVDLSSDPTVAHINIDKNANVQAEIARKIIEVVKAN
jgi:Serine hydrolase